MKLASCLIGIFVAAPAFAQSVIQWNYNNQAAGLGNGCGPGEVRFISAGNEVSVIFSGLGVEMNGGDSTNGLTAKKTCRIVIPTKVQAGYYLGKLEQTITYGYTRTDSTSGQILAYTEFYGQKAGNMSRAIPTPGLNPYNVPSAQMKDVGYWRVNPEWCQARSYIGNFKANLTVTGRRSTAAKDLKISIDGHDIRFDAVGDAYLCN